MNTRTRYFITAASVVMVAGLCTGLVAYYSGGLPLLASRATANEDLSYMPADAPVVAYVNVRDIMSSDFRQRLREVAPSLTGEGRNEFFDETGIDLERDVTSVMLALGNVADVKQGHPEKQMIVLVRGVFNPPVIIASATQRGATLTDYKGKQLLTKEDGGVAFIEPGLAIVGSVAGIQRAIDAHAGANLAAGGEMNRLVSAVDPSANAWAVGRLDGFQDMAGLPDQIKSQMPAVQWFSLTGRVDSGISGAVRAEARDDQSAENLRAVVNGALALARLNLGKDAKLDAIINSLQLSGTGRQVGLSFNLSSDVLTTLGAFASEAGKQLHDGPMGESHDTHPAPKGRKL